MLIKKKMTQAYYRLFATFLGILGLVLGFSAKVIAQYGAPPAIRFNGIISSKECNLPLKSIKLTVSTPKNNYKVTTYTNEKGEFRISLYDDYSDEPRAIRIEASDTDGVASGGYFASKTFDVTAKKRENQTFNFQLNHIDTPPCDLNKTDPEPKKGNLSNSVATKKETKDILVQNPPNSEGGIEPAFTVVANQNHRSFIIEFTAKKVDETRLFITNNSGNQLFEKIFIPVKGKQKVTINTNLLPLGTYYFSLMQGAAIATQKIIIL